jgi:hypothetical protein
MSSHSTAPHGHGWASYVWGVILHGIVFAAAGPPIGAFFSPGVIFWPFAAILAYITSAWAAFATGCCVGIASSFLIKPRALFAFAALTGAILGGSVPFTIAGILNGANDVGLILMFAFPGAMAAAICTHFTSGLRLTRTNAAWDSM